MGRDRAERAEDAEAGRAVARPARSGGAGRRRPRLGRALPASLPAAGQDGRAAGTRPRYRGTTSCRTRSPPCTRPGRGDRHRQDAGAALCLLRAAGWSTGPVRVPPGRAGLGILAGVRGVGAARAAARGPGAAALRRPAGEPGRGGGRPQRGARSAVRSSPAVLGRCRARTTFSAERPGARAMRDSAWPDVLSAGPAAAHRGPRALPVPERRRYRRQGGDDRQCVHARERRVHLVHGTRPRLRSTVVTLVMSWTALPTGTCWSTGSSASPG